LKIGGAATRVTGQAIYHWKKQYTGVESDQ
jgi:hypothetical protein